MLGPVNLLTLIPLSDKTQSISLLQNKGEIQTAQERSERFVEHGLSGS